MGPESLREPEAGSMRDPNREPAPEREPESEPVRVSESERESAPG